MRTPGKHVVFGKVIRGFDDVVTKIAQVTSDEKDRPTVPVTIFNCGELELRKKAEPPRSCTLLFFCVRDDGLLLIPLLVGASPLAKETSVSASESEEDDEEEERSHKRHKRRRRSRSPADAAKDDSGKRHKRKHKHKRRKDPEGSPSRSGKVEPAGERKETEEEYDARLEREENERLAAERKRDLERLSRQDEPEPPSTNGVRFKGATLSLIIAVLVYDTLTGRGRMKFVDPELHRRR